ncbi:MAG: polyisoprenoid-binding protein [Methylotenera sp.]|nr:polyisoprenoid-binding protein [Oligoflexia bacterium]
MKKIILSLGVLALSLTSASAFAAKYAVDPAHSSVNFTIRHLVSNVDGKFNDYTGEFSFDEKKPTVLGDVKFDIKAASVDTGNAKRDEHLKGGDFFDVQKNPELTFVGKKVTSSGKNMFKVLGDFTMHGVTKPVTLDVEYLGSTKGMDGSPTSGFTATTVISRKDFGMIWNKVLDAGNAVLGDDVKVKINVEAHPVSAAAKK